MKYIALYLLFSIILTFFARLYRPLIDYANRYIVESIVLISYPVTSFLDDVKVFTDRYLVVLNQKKENELLKKRIVQLELENKFLKAQHCAPAREPGLKGGIIRGKFKFKNNFNIDFMFIQLEKPVDLKHHNCSVFSTDMHLIGKLIKHKGSFWVAKTVFNSSFVADAYIVSNGLTYRALFIGNLYKPKAEFLDPNAVIKIGSKVYASGAFGVFPRGSFIGRVSSVTNVNNYYKVAYVSIDKSFFNQWNVYVVCIKK